jgi:hypothetical protein
VWTTGPSIRRTVNVLTDLNYSLRCSCCTRNMPQRTALRYVRWIAFRSHRYRWSASCGAFRCGEAGRVHALPRDSRHAPRTALRTLPRRLSPRSVGASAAVKSRSVVSGHLGTLIGMLSVTPFDAPRVAEKPPSSSREGSLAILPPSAGGGRLWSCSRYRVKRSAKPTWPRKSEIRSRTGKCLVIGLSVAAATLSAPCSQPGFRPIHTTNQNNPRMIVATTIHVTTATVGLSSHCPTQSVEVGL